MHTSTASSSRSRPNAKEVLLLHADRPSSSTLHSTAMEKLSNLLPELLQVIAKRFDKLEDFVSFRCVSRSLFAALKDAYFEGQLAPYLMLPVKDYVSDDDDDDDDDDRYHVRALHSLVKGESTAASIKVPDLDTKKCFESLGWLLIIGDNDYDDYNMTLLDPFSGTEILLPGSLSAFQGRKSHEEFMDARQLIQKMVLSARPTETLDFVLMVIYGDSQYLGFWRLGDDHWNYIDCLSKGLNCTDVVYDGVGKLFYAIGFPAAVWAFNLAEHCNKEEGRLITSCEEVSPRNLTSNLYIVKTVDALLFITREVPDIRDEDKVCCMNTEFGVYKVNIARGKYKQIDSLGSMAVFLGQSSSTIAVDVSTFPGGVIKPNHIYFTDDVFIGQSMGMDVGVYKMETKTVEPIYMGEPLFSKISPSLWITPSPGNLKLPPNFEETTWAMLKSAIVGIFLQQPDPCDLKKLYQAVRNLCIHKMGGSLYPRIEKECEAHISAALQSLVGQSDDLVVFLSLVEKCWQDFCEQMLMIHRIALGIALVLDTTCMKQIKVPSLWDIGLHLFRKHLALASEVESKTVFGLLKLIDSERLGEAVDRTLLNHLLKMFSALGIYTESFEKPFLERTSEFYAAEEAKFMHQSDILDYLKHVELRLHEEHERCLLYLNAVTRRPLLATVEMQLFERHVAAILEKGFTMLMDGHRIEDLQRMYTLFLRLNALEPLRQALSSYIRKTGQGVMDEEKDKDMVSSLLEFMLSVDKVLVESFCTNAALCSTIVEAFEHLLEHLINIRSENRLAELIAKFLDEKLLAGNKGTSEEELEDKLGKVLVFLQFIQGKDVFEAFYKKDLAKRLLLGKSASIDAEKFMISKLKTLYGSQFTNKLEGMFKDFELSKEINESFKQSSQARTKLPPGIEMSVHVLTTGYWPTYPPMDVQIPHELNMYQDIFKEFYLSKHGGRRLMWQNSLGHCVLKAEFPKGKKELAVSLFQTVVLMLFNDAFKLSFQDIKESTGIEDKELRRTLQSLACGKVCVLQKIPKGKEVEDNDTFEFNDQFTAPLHRIKVNAIQMKETVENTSTTERVFQDRQYQVDAAIVRIMKTRKVLSHTLLITELFQQLEFPIKPADLKKRIESLIDREYLERDKNNSQIYHYLA